MSAKVSRNVRVPAENSDADMAFAARVVDIANRVGSATKLAEMTGIARRSIGHYMAGEAEPSRPRLIAMAEAAKVRLEWLATGVGPMEAGENEARGRSSELNTAVLIAAIHAVEEMLTKQDLAASPDEKSILISSVYNLRIREKKQLK